ncbi:MAG TPA: ribose 5-phosphate isomerase B [Bacteroidota bacterium]|nr:ribose 5-phosphate isomerase B [Bacteroidota bacterium]
MAKKILTEQDIVNAAREGKQVLFADRNTIVTPSARDKARALNIRLTDQAETTSQPRPETPPAVYATSSIPSTNVGSKLIVIGSDHGGFQTKEMVKRYLAELGYKTLDVGTNSEEACDYPDYAYAVARIVAKGEAWRGIMIDATGVASSIVCNKVPGVRAAACFNEFVAQSSREHNDANVLTLGAKVLGAEVIKSIIKIWLETWFGGGRHKKRVDKITDVEKKFTK